MKSFKKSDFLLPCCILFFGLLWIYAAEEMTSANKLIAALLSIPDSVRDGVFVTSVSVLIFFILKKHRLKVEASKKEYLTLFDCNPVPMWIFDKETFAFLEVNQAAIQHYSYSKVEFLSMNLKDIRPVSEWALLSKYQNQLQRQEYTGMEAP